RITAKGYKVHASEGDLDAEAEPGILPGRAGSGEPAAPVAPGAASQRYYIATVYPPGRTGMAGWDIDAFINQAFVKRFRSRDPDPLVEVTRFLHAGANVIHFAARREEGARASTSQADFFELVLGDGETRGGEVTLHRLAAYRRNASESGAFQSD